MGGFPHPCLMYEHIFHDIMYSYMLFCMRRHDAFTNSHHRAPCCIPAPQKAKAAARDVSSMPAGYSPALLGLVMAMLEPDEAKRPTLAEVSTSLCNATRSVQ